MSVVSYLFSLNCCDSSEPVVIWWPRSPRPYIQTEHHGGQSSRIATDRSRINLSTCLNQVGVQFSASSALV